MNTVISILIIIGLLLIPATLLARVFFAGSVTFIKNKAKTVSATVLGKRKKDMFRSSGIYTNYFITFDLGGSDRLELPVNKKLFKADNIGKSGKLTYKGGFFVSFITDEELKSKEKPKKETYILNGEVVEK